MDYDHADLDARSPSEDRTAVLEREEIAIGAVTGIQETRWPEIVIAGAAAHAGAATLLECALADA